VSDVHVAKQRCVLAEAAWSAQSHHMRWALLYKRGLVWEPLGEPRGIATVADLEI